MATIQERMGADGKKGYRVMVRLKGHAPETATFERLTDARKWAQKIEAAMREGRYFPTRESKRHTLADAIDRYQRDVLPKKKLSTQATQFLQLEWWKTRLGALPLADVRPATIAEARDVLLGEKTRQGTPRSPAAVVRYLAVLSHLFSIAIRDWEWTTENPVKNISKPKEPRGRVRFLSDEERRRLLAACAESQNTMLLDIVLIALCTGMRKGEILGLRWRDVDLDAGTLTVADSKNGESRVVPIVGEVLDRMKARAKIRRIDTNLVFPAPEREGPVYFENAWRAAKKRAELENFKFHDCRHTAASYLLMAGASTIEIAEVLGHKTLQMTKRYSHASLKHKTNLSERLTAAVFAAPQEREEVR